MFDQVKWFTLQQPIIMLVAMVTGKDINELLRMEVHERLKLINQIISEIGDVTTAAVVATDPAGPGGVTITEEEFAIMIDEAADIKTAAKALTDSFTGTTDGGATGG